MTKVKKIDRTKWCQFHLTKVNLSPKKLTKKTVNYYIINNLLRYRPLKREAVSSYEKYKTKCITSFNFQLKQRTKRKREDHSLSLLLLSIRNLRFLVVGWSGKLISKLNVHPVNDAAGNILCSEILRFFCLQQATQKISFYKEINFMVSIVITAVICPFLIYRRFLKMFSQSKKQVWWEVRIR